MKAVFFLILAALLFLQVTYTTADGEQECVPGTTFKRDCNSCYCGDNGVPICTLMGCLNAPVGEST